MYSVNFAAVVFQILNHIAFYLGKGTQKLTSFIKLAVSYIVADRSVMFSAVLCCQLLPSLFSLLEY